MKLITIIGPSGAGKDTVALMLSAILGYDVLCSYTTRPMREGEVDGKRASFCQEMRCSKKRNARLHPIRKL